MQPKPKSRFELPGEPEQPNDERPAGSPVESFRITDAEFAQVRALAYKLAGISIAPSKKALIVGRWGRRLTHHGLASFQEYLQLLAAERDGAELQIALDLLTTNETYFFREPKHFEFLRTEVLPRVARGTPFRVWSAAASSGEEAYSLAMLLAAEMPDAPWSILGTDISARVLKTARAALYDLTRTDNIPTGYLQRFCLKGKGPQMGKFMIAKNLRDRVQFERANLNEPLPKFGQFDVIFLRNVLIYFDAATKERVIQHLLPSLKSGGYFIIGHCDALAGVGHALVPCCPSVYRKS